MDKLKEIFKIQKKFTKHFFRQKFDLSLDEIKNSKELKDMERYAFRKFYLRPSYIIKRILKIRTLEDINRYLKGGKTLIKSFL